MRLAGHDFMDFRIHPDGSTTGGSDACLNFDDPDNKGLVECLTQFELPSAYKPVCNRVSLADFIVIAGEAVMGRTATDYNEDDYFADGTLAKTLREGFKSGRVTNENCDEPVGLMPNPELGCEGLKEIFHDHIYKSTGMPWTMTAAISGAHSLGSAKLQNSGYSGFWSDVRSQGFFNNDYYKSILAVGWAPDLSVNGNPEKNQWKRVDAARDSTHIEMMLTTDLCMAFRNNPGYVECMRTTKVKRKNKHCGGLHFKDGIDLNPHFKTCCTWTNANNLFRSGLFVEGQNNDFCGVTVQSKSKQQRQDCCSGIKQKGVPLEDCDSQTTPQGPAFKSIMAFAANETEWLNNFHLAWKFATENGNPTLQFIDQEARLETVIPVDAQPFDCSVFTKQWPCNENHQCKFLEDNPQPVDDETEALADAEDEELAEVAEGKEKKKKKKWQPKGKCVPV